MYASGIFCHVDLHISTSMRESAPVAALPLLNYLTYFYLLPIRIGHYCAWGQQYVFSSKLLELAWDYIPVKFCPMLQLRLLSEPEVVIKILYVTWYCYLEDRIQTSQGKCVWLHRKLNLEF